MAQIYKAHVNESTQAIQTVKEHSENTAQLCKDFCKSLPCLQNLMYTIGMLHDCGKFQESFQNRINGNKNIRVEHSTCGAIVAKEQYPYAIGLLMAYCIAGHHGGIPNGGCLNDTDADSTLQGRMKRKFEDYGAYKEELNILELNHDEIIRFLAKDCNKDVQKLISKFAFLTRFSFSCLTDADSMDTAAFCGNAINRELKADFCECLRKVNAKLDSFRYQTDLQRARADLQKQVFQRVKEDSEIYLLNMPTGSGKTLCSVKFALERAIQGKKKRIIYIIPYNSIIDQTVSEFEAVFGESAEILRHQSSFSYEDCEKYSEDYREAAKSAVENWNCQFIVTTAVQFFESVYGNRRGKLRKLHNMADSVLIFDEAHLMPEKYLQPCLQAISYLTKYFNSEAMLLTATMPNFNDLIIEYALDSSNVLELVEDTSIFPKFQKCRFTFLGELEKKELLAKATQMPTCLIVVNKKATVRELYSMASGNKIQLSTYLASYDRQAIIENIKKELLKLEEDYPNLENVPEERRIIVISTSLIEAGVDLDFFAVFRELAGVDNILQAGGRCNREGKRAPGCTSIFSIREAMKNPSADERGNITKGLFEKYKDISDSDCIREYYDKLFFSQIESMKKNSIEQRCGDLASIPFEEYAKEFQIVDSQTVNIVVEKDSYSKRLIEELKHNGYADTRRLQKYACSVSYKEFEDLRNQHAICDYNTGIYCLTNANYYDEKIGITFESKDYFL